MKKNSAFDNTTDTDETSDRGMQNDTATLQNTVSESEDTTSSQNNNDIENKNVKPTIGELRQAAETEIKQAQAQYDKYSVLIKKELGEIGAKYAKMDSAFKTINDISNEKRTMMCCIALRNQ